MVFLYKDSYFVFVCMCMDSVCIVYVQVNVFTHVCSYVWRSEVNVGIFFSHSLSYFLSQGLSLNLGLIEAASARDPPVSASSSLAMDMCCSAQLLWAH